MKDLLSAAAWAKKKRCRYCHSTTNAEAPCCDACGFDFTGTPPALRFEAPWKGRIIATGTGLVAVAIVWFQDTNDRSDGREAGPAPLRKEQAQWPAS